MKLGDIVMKILMSLFISLLSAMVLFNFQNCSSEVEFGNAPVASNDSNDNSNSDLGKGDNCIPGKRLGVWLDPNNSGKKEESNYLGSFVAFNGSLNSEANYNYYSASAHPEVGPTPEGFALNVFFYDGSDGLSLNFFSNIDAGGSSDNIVNLDVKTSGNDNLDKVILSDDNNELKKNSDGNYSARFHYWSNTDGGVIGPFDGTDFEIHVSMLETGDVVKARFFTSNGNGFDLKHNNSISSFIIAYKSFETCN
jgi:hypothetical protein